MKLNLVTAPTIEPISMDSLSIHLRLDAEDMSENELLESIVKAAREQVEAITRRALFTQTWDYWLDGWPPGDRIKLPFGNLQTAGLSVKYTNSAGTQTTMTLTTDYLIETNGEGCGYIVLPYNDTWPSFTPYPTHPIVIRFTCGWTTRALVPYKIKAACLLIAADLYTNREAQVLTDFASTYQENKTVINLLFSYRLWDEFY